MQPGDEAWMTLEASGWRRRALAAEAKLAAQPEGAAEAGEKAFCSKCGFYGAPMSDGSHQRPHSDEWCPYLAAAPRPQPEGAAEAGEAGDELPCDVMLPPRTVIKAGCTFATLRLAMGVEYRPRSFEPRDLNPTPRPQPEGAPTPAVTQAEIPAGMKAWAGGPKPADWDGEAVQFRSGEVKFAPPADTVWKLGWDHSYGDGDIIAYTVKSPADDARALVEAARALLDFIGPNDMRVYASDPPVKALRDALARAERQDGRA